MSPVFAIAIYFVVWWIVLFAVLPFHIRTQEEAGEVVPGTPASAPASFNLFRLVVANTIVASIVFAFIYALIVFDPLGIGQIPEELQF
ncbi:MAG: DUF1467 family protein [Pseudomonadota bacterium]